MKEKAASLTDKVRNPGLDVAKLGNRGGNSEPGYNGPPLALPDGHGKLLENGYKVFVWDDGFVYLYDEDGNLVEGERYIDEASAEERANELKPPGPRR